MQRQFQIPELGSAHLTTLSELQRLSTESALILQYAKAHISSMRQNTLWARK